MSEVCDRCKTGKGPFKTESCKRCKSHTTQMIWNSFLKYQNINLNPSEGLTMMRYHNMTLTLNENIPKRPPKTHSDAPQLFLIFFFEGRIRM